MSAATPHPSARMSSSTMPVACLMQVLFEVLELKDVGLHRRYMGLANFAHSLD